MDGQRRSGGATAEPVAVLEAAIQRMVQDAKSKALAKGAAAAAVPFLPSPAFQGRRRGYVFTTRGQGVGYYLDPRQPPPEADDEGSGGEGDEEEEPQQQRAQQLDPEELLRRAEEEAGEVQTLDARSLRRVATQLEKKARENLELRMKYASEPMKFLENEIDLLSMVREIGQVAGSPELYPVLIDSPALPTLLGMLGHENADLAVEVVDLLMELTDADAVEEYGDEARALVAALVEGDGLELLFQALSRFDESNEEEAAGVNKALATIEHMAEITPQLAETVFEKTALLKWLLARVRRRASDSNRLYASELLAILMQGREGNQRRLAAANGIDAILLSISPYKGRDPQDAEEQEYLENLFDALCSCLMLPENRAAFVAAEGVELMFLLLKAKRASRYGAVKALDFACTLCPPACDRLVEVGGLAPLFALFMGRTKVKGPKGDKASRDVTQEMEERSVSLVSSLLQHVTKAALRDRVAAKFVEAEFEKADMLVEVMFRYEDRVAAVEARLAPQFEAGEVDEGDVISEQLEAGLFTLQGCVVIVAALWASGDAGLRKRLLALLHQRGRSLDMIREYLFDYYVGLEGDDSATAKAASSKAASAAAGGDEASKQRRRLAAFLTAIGVDAEEAEAARRQRQAGGEAAGDADAAAGGAGAAAKAAAAPADPNMEEGERADDDVDMEIEQGDGDSPAPPAAAPGRSNGAAAPARGGSGGGGGGGGGGGDGRETARGEDKGARGRGRSRSRSRSRSRERAPRDRSRSRSRERREKERERERDRDARRPDRKRSRSRSRSRERRRRSSRSRSRERRRR